MQVQLLTVLVRLEEVPLSQVRDVYKLLLDDSHAVRHAAAELVTDMLEESGQRHLAQVMLFHSFSLLLSRLHRKGVLHFVHAGNRDSLQAQSCFVVMHCCCPLLPLPSQC